MFTVPRPKYPSFAGESRHNDHVQRELAWSPWWPLLSSRETHTTKLRDEYLPRDQKIDILFVNTTITVKKDEIINASSSDFDLRGFQSLSGIWRRPTAGCSAKWLYWRDDQTVPLVLGSITIMIISYRATVLQSGG